MSFFPLLMSYIHRQQSGIYGLPGSRLAILPGTTHIGMILWTDWLIPMISDFLDSDLNPAPPRSELYERQTTVLKHFIILCCIFTP